MFAYSLREEFAGTVDLHGDGVEVPAFSGATVTYADGRTFDVREALEAGDGVIVVPDTSELVQRLDGVVALKRVPVEEDVEPISTYTGQPVSALRELARARGIAGAGRASRAALEAALAAQDEAVADGDQVTAGTTEQPATVEDLTGDLDLDPNRDAAGAADPTTPPAGDDQAAGRQE